MDAVLCVLDPIPPSKTKVSISVNFSSCLVGSMKVGGKFWGEGIVRAVANIMPS